MWLRGSVAVRWQTLKRGKTAKIAKAVQDEEEEEEEVTQRRAAGMDGGEQSALVAEANAIKSEALQEKQLQQQQRVSEVSLCRPRGAMFVLPHSCLAMAPLCAIKRRHAPRGIKRRHAPEYLLHGSYASWWHARVSWAMHAAAPMLRTLGHSVQAVTAENVRCEKEKESCANSRRQWRAVTRVCTNVLCSFFMCLLCGVLHSDWRG